MKNLKNICRFGRFILVLLLVFVITGCSSDNKISFNVEKDRDEVKGIYINEDKSNNMYDSMVEIFKKSVSEKYDVNVEKIENLILQNLETFDIEGKKVIFSNFQYSIFGERKNTLSFYEFNKEEKKLKKLDIVLDNEAVNEIDSLNNKYEKGEIICSYFNPFTYKDDESKDFLDFKYKFKISEGKVILNTIETDYNKEHDLDKASKFTDLISVSLLKIDRENKGFMKCVNSVFSDNAYNKDYKIIDKDDIKEFEKTYVLSLYSAVDLFNSYNKDTYEIDVVYNGIKNEAEASGFYEYMEINDSFELYDKNKLNDLLHHDINSSNKEKFKLVYFSKDKKYVYRFYPGAGGMSINPVERDKWEISGDRIKIRFYKFQSDEISDSYIILRLNNKNYPYNKKKSKYYVEEFKYVVEH